MHIREEDRRAERENSGLLPLVFGMVVALGILVNFAPNQRIDFEQTGLGINTRENFSSKNGEVFHCSDFNNGDQCIKTMNKNKGLRHVLWFGASQLHAINDMQPGDRTAVSRLHEKLLLRDTLLTAFSQANGNLQEHDVLFEYIRQKARVDVLVLGMVYDDMRESGVRATIKGALLSKKTAKALAQSSTGRLILQRYKDGGKDISSSPKKYTTLQQKTEAYLNERLSRMANVWAARADFRGQLVVALDKLRRQVLIARNAIFGIDSKKWTVRIDDGQYAVNRGALAAILQSAQRAKIPVLLYVAPRPIDAYFPYDLQKYQAYKNDIAKLGASYGVTLVNLEDTVKGDVWGTIDNGVGKIVTDIFHFKASGHAQMAKSIFKALDPILKGLPNQ